MNDIFENLSDDQKAAVAHGDGPLLIVAGAGTGKTTAITRRIAHLLVSRTLKPNELLALTFTDKASREMEDRVARLLPYGSFDTWIMTFHSFCERILAEHGIDIGIGNHFRLLTESQSALLIWDNFKRFDFLEYYAPLGNPTKFISALISHFSKLKDELIAPEEYLAFAKKMSADLDTQHGGGVVDEEAQRITELARAYKEYEQVLLDNNCLDFGDVLLYVMKLFKTRKKILEEYRAQFKYILVDEFQDTNVAQYEVLKLLSAPRNNLTVVSDDDQAIYRWRGASYNNVLQFQKDFPDASHIVLTNNYRSRQEILDFSYAFIQQNNPYRLEAQSEHFKKKLVKKLKATRDGKAEIAYKQFDTAEEEAAFVARTINKLKEKNPEATYNDFAVLVRKNDSAELFSRVLRWSGIPHEFLAARGLYAKPTVLDIINYLKLLDNYHESSALYRVLSTPLFVTEISNDDLSTLTHSARKNNLSLYEALRRAATYALSQKSLAAINKLLLLVESHSSRAKKDSASVVAYAFLKESGYLEYLAEGAREGKQECIDNLLWTRQFFNKILEFETTSLDKSVMAFNRMMRAFLDAGDEGGIAQDISESGPETVKVLTIHSAKGLEFRYVFIVHLADRIFPTMSRKDPIEISKELIKEIVPEGDVHLQEERRLFYVALTRAKDTIFLTCAKDYGGARERKPSRFIVELGLALPEEKKGKKNDVKKKISDLPESLELAIASRKTGSSKTLDGSPREEKNPFKMPERFSFTQLRAFETCPLQYKFGHLLSIPRISSPQFTFGKVMHETLRQFFHLHQERGVVSDTTFFSASGTKKENTVRATIEELMNVYNSAWKSEGYRDKKEEEAYKKNGEKILKEFFEIVKNNPPRVRHLEMPFTLKIDDEIIKGQIDRVDEIEGGLEIIDYKTGTPPKEGTLLFKDKEQLLLYAIAGAELFKEPIVRLTYYYLNENKPVSFERKEKDMERLREKIKETIIALKSSNFTADPGMHCKWCDFKDICQFRQI